MSTETRPSYTEFHPRWYRRRISPYWWLERPSYVAFIARELSSVFIGWFVVYLLLFIRAVKAGPGAYSDFLIWARSPWLVAINVVSLLFVTFHALTWFNLAPKALVLHFRGKKVPGAWVAGANYAAWAVVSVLVAWLVLGG
jgi:fumarate reductase subunit C